MTLKEEVNSNSLLRHINNEITTDTDGLLWIKRRRFIVCVFMFFGYFIAHCSQVNLSMAIVAMTKERKLDNGTILQAEFDWVKRGLIGHILSSFYYGYFTTQLFGGWLACRYGSKIILGCSIGIPAIISLLTPVATMLDATGMIIIRILLGIFSGPLYPTCPAIWAEWAPPLERNSLITYTFTGGNCGSIIIVLIGGVLSQQLGWQSFFYFPGGLGLIWLALWIFFYSEKPSSDRFITKQELIFITEKLKEEKIESTEKTSHPWKAILTSPPVLANIFTFFCSQYGFNTILTMMPTYYKDVLQFDLNFVGYMSAIAYASISIMLPISGRLADYIIAHNYLTTTMVRKLWVGVSLTLQTILLMMLLVITDKGGMVCCLSIAFGFNGVSFGSLISNPLDLGRQHASVISGMSNTLGNIAGIAATIIAGYMIMLENGWAIIYSVIAAVSILAIIIISIFGSGEQQPWAIENTNNLENKNEYN